MHMDHLYVFFYVCYACKLYECYVGMLCMHVHTYFYEFVLNKREKKKVVNHLFCTESAPSNLGSCRFKTNLVVTRKSLCLKKYVFHIYFYISLFVHLSFFIIWCCFYQLKFNIKNGRVHSKFDTIFLTNIYVYRKV